MERFVIDEWADSDGKHRIVEDVSGRFTHQRIFENGLGQRMWESTPLDPREIWNRYPGTKPRYVERQERWEDRRRWIEARWWRRLMRDLGFIL